MYENKKIFILGMARSGYEVAKLLSKHNNEILITDKIKENDILVLDISDYLLLDMYRFKTNISVLTNLYSNHLDFHGSYENYISTKKKIFNNHKDDDIAIINGDSLDCLKLTNDIVSTKEFFSSKKRK